MNVDIAGVPEMHVGNVVANVASTNFFLSRNLIEQDPDDTLAGPPSSTISNPGDKGVFINAISASFGTVELAIDGVSDVLAQVVFDVSMGASGNFVISLGEGSSLGDESFDDVPFTSEPLVITVTTPATAACCDRTTGTCTDDIAESDCRGDQQEWFNNTPCSVIDCRERRGACCDGATGNCDEGVLAGDCTGGGTVWYKNLSCDDAAVVCGCPQDFNGDGLVGPADLARLLDHWGPCPEPPGECPWDLNREGTVGAADLANLLDTWGPCP